jgi:hypothetical protein
MSSKSVVKSLTLQGVLVAALGTAGTGTLVTEDAALAARLDKIASVAGLLLATVGRLRKKDLHVRAAKVAAALLLVGLLGACSALGLGGSSLEASATAANRDNIVALVRENSAYTAADTSLPPALKETREARNAEAVKLAENLAGSR